MNFGIGETVIPDGYNNMAWNAKKINDFINNYCDGFSSIVLLPGFIFLEKKSLKL